MQKLAVVLPGRAKMPDLCKVCGEPTVPHKRVVLQDKHILSLLIGLVEKVGPSQPSVQSLLLPGNVCRRPCYSNLEKYGKLKSELVKLEASLHGQLAKLYCAECPVEETADSDVLGPSPTKRPRVSHFPVAARKKLDFTSSSSSPPVTVRV